jgi:hypothetical protein
VLVAIAAGVEVAVSSAGGGADPTAAALALIPGSKSAKLLEQKREQIILENFTAKTLSFVGSPKLATRPAPPPLSSSSSSSAGGGGGTPVIPSGPPPNAGTAQSIAYNMMPSFGFDPKSQFGCLDNLWNRESGWRYNAANASGAYGIPQALPGSKMASAGADWETNPATQIRWGLGYIKSVYGTPCNAWGHELADGWY